MGGKKKGMKGIILPVCNPHFTRFQVVFWVFKHFPFCSLSLLSSCFLSVCLCSSSYDQVMFGLVISLQGSFVTLEYSAAVGSNNNLPVDLWEEARVTTGNQAGEHATVLSTPTECCI